MRNATLLAALIALLLGACSAEAAPPPEAIGSPAGMTSPPPGATTPPTRAEAPTTTTDSAPPAPAAEQYKATATATDSAPPANESPRRVPPQKASWHIQYSGEINYDLEADVYNIDLFDTPTDEIEKLRQRGVFVMCYFSAGSYEDWRPDAAQFPQEVLGNDYEGWEGEIWLDVRRLDLLAPIMSARLDLAVRKGCDGVDPDNVNGYENETGFPLSYEDQLAYNRWLAEEAHARGLSIGLKNDLEQIPDLLPDFDWALNESCFYYEECGALTPFIAAGKPVFVVEYDLNPEAFCPQAKSFGFNAIYKNQDLDGFATSCE